ncbi:hypothetical protein ATANTOWER_032640 [Ataeniobius toweri]|uniref:Uncharacterized protein n=1 Tax=Ataeniobius toweri TaxID=208326 RepID=A0ABU7BLS2_9TELE|nr:hypothetical protein [Ataeniobius toweri]
MHSFCLILFFFVLCLHQMNFPSNPLQPGPIYFLTPRKCGLFGVSCEGLQKQVNFLIDEGTSSGKGSNEVMHHFFTHFGVGETDVGLHCDKTKTILCCGMAPGGLDTSFTPH